MFLYHILVQSPRFNAGSEPSFCKPFQYSLYVTTSIYSTSLLWISGTNYKVTGGGAVAPSDFETFLQYQVKKKSERGENNRF